MKKQKILYVEDEIHLGRIVKESLESKGFDVRLLTDGAEVLRGFENYNPDICVLDVMLPSVDGFTLGKHIRNLYPKLPIIFLTALSQTDDLVTGFSSGGTDYVKKPFSMEELYVRIENQLKLVEGQYKINEERPEEIALGTYVFLPHKFELKSPITTFKLSNRDVQVLNLLSAHRNQVIERSKLLLAVWGDDSFFNSRTLDVYIRKLREYFSEDEDLQIITLKGKGYHFLVP